MRTPSLLADFIHARDCKPFCEKLLTLPLPKKGNPLNEIVTYKVGGTLYEVSTVCGGSELLYDKMKRLIKSETVKTPAYKEKEVRYNKDNNLFVGRSLQEE